VRKWLLVLSPLFLLLLISAGVKFSDSLVLYVRYAPLYSQAPDRKLSMPVQGVAKKQIANTWGAPRGDSRHHEGQDIFAPLGTPVLSATDGYIVKIGEDNLGGHTVSVIGAGGRIYYYAHLDSYARNISVGDQVTRQTVLGYVGTTGNATGTPPHLHFGIYASGAALNPLPLLTDRTAQRTDNGAAVAIKRAKPTPLPTRQRLVAPRT